MQDVTFALSIAELGLGARAQKALTGAGISTVGDALAALEEGGDEALTDIKGFGPKSLADLKRQLVEHGFSSPSEMGQARAPRVARALEEEAALAATLLAEDARAEEVLEEELPESVAPVTIEQPEAAVEKPVTEPEPAIAARPALAKEAPAELPSFGQRLRATLAHVRGQPGGGAWAYGAIAVLIIVALILPPISLLQRVGLAGYTTLNAENNTISHDDGLTLSVDPETFEGKLRVRLDAAPRQVFLMGDAGFVSKKAVAALPSYLQVKSPLYQIRTRGNPGQSVTIDVVMPNEAEPWETLDLYTWSGESWEWVGGELHTEMAEHEHISAHVTDVPDNLVVVQVGAITRTVSTYLEADDSLASAAGLLDEVNPVGMLLGTDGGFVGDPDSLLQPVEGDAYAVLPTLRNWAPGAAINRELLSDLLTLPETRAAHIASIVQFCTERGFAGVDVDYRGVTPEERDEYSDFIGALADALHAEGLRLTVVVEAAAPTNGGWDSGGYDWAAIGSVADAVKAPFPDDPAAYAEMGEAQRLLDWATAQVSRHKLRMLVSSLSAELNSAGIEHITLGQALAPFGNATAIEDVAHVEPGSQVTFGFAGHLLSITPQENGGTYRLEYEAAAGEINSVWLGTPSNLTLKLNWARRYCLGGVAVSDVLAAGNASGSLEAVMAYRNGSAPPAGQEMDVVWTISSAEAGISQQAAPLTEPDYVWTVLVPTGTYTVGATIAGFDHGSVTVNVGAPEVTEVITAAEAIVVSEPAAAVGAAPDECFDASYVADVTIPDNTQLDNGEGFVKTWRVRNSGSCAWSEDAVLAFSEGSQMGAPESVAVGALEPGAETEVSVDMVAPADAGRYSGIWRMQTAQGFFGSNLSVVIQAGEVTTPAPVAVAPVSGGSFELGGHVRDTAFPYADKMHYAGMNWSKVQVHYGQDVSGLVAASHAQGFKIQLSALGSPNMVTQAGFEQNFANWVAGLAAAGADAIEVWNEPNIDREWQIGHISPQAYTNLLCASYNAIKAANAGTAVISAAPAPTGYFGGCGPDGCDDAPWMAGLRDAGAANCMDYIGAHHNSGATSPSARIGHPANPGDTHHSWFFLPQTELYYNTFGGARKLFYTEMGYASQEGVPTFSDAFGWARGTNNAQQAAWLAEAVQLSVNTGMVRCIIVWNIDFTRYGYDPQDGYAIVRPGGGCPACDSLHNLLGTR